MTRITVRNNIFQHIQVLKTNRTKRTRYGEFVVEGVRNINEAIKNEWQIKSFFCEEGELSDWAKELYDPEVIAASMGSFFSLPVLRIAEPDTLYEMINRMKASYGTFHMFGSTAHQQKAIYELDMTSPLMLFIGNETKGLSYAYKELCEELCTIPMAESSTASSFNVSCAASIMMYEVVRQRKGKL